MFWITLIFCAVAAWAVLSLLAVDHSDRMARLQGRLREAAERAAQQDSASDQIPVIGGPPDPTHP